MKSILIVAALAVGQIAMAKGLSCENAFKEDPPVYLTAGEVRLGDALEDIALTMGTKEISRVFEEAKYDPDYKPRPNNKNYDRYNLMEGNKVRSAFSLLIPKKIKGSKFQATFVEARAGYHGETEYTKLICSLVERSSGPPCENYAKYGAIKAYRAEFGGDGEISAKANIVSGEGDVYAYYVYVEAAVNDGADDGTAQVTYEVDVQYDPTVRKCTVKSARKIKLPQ